MICGPSGCTHCKCPKSGHPCPVDPNRLQILRENRTQLVIRKCALNILYFGTDFLLPVKTLAWQAGDVLLWPSCWRLTSLGSGTFPAVSMQMLTKGSWIWDLNLSSPHPNTFFDDWLQQQSIFFYNVWSLQDHSANFLPITLAWHEHNQSARTY